MSAAPRWTGDGIPGDGVATADGDGPSRWGVNHTASRACVSSVEPTLIY